MDIQERKEILQRPAFRDSYYINLLLSCGDYPSLQQVISCERFSLDKDEPKWIWLSGQSVRVQEFPTEPEFFTFIASEEYHWHSDPPYLKYPDPMVFTKVWTIAS